MKIDLVYLWVDGSDENWLAKKNEQLIKAGKAPTNQGVRASRWLNNDELKYSLRSVEKYAPWVNHIFIATDGQIPEWLDTNNPKITIVDHKEFIPHNLLPLFNSTALEMFLWNIPGLSEHFIYSNDDMFFGKPVEPDLFFDENGNPVTIFKNRYYKNSKRLKRHWNSLSMTEKYFGVKFNVTQKHAIEPFRQSYMKETAERFYNEVILPSATPFRTNENFKRMFFPLVDNALGRNTITMNWRVSEKRIVYNYKKETIIRFVYRKMLWFFATIFGFIKYDCFDMGKQKHIVKYLKFYRPEMFCLNHVNTEIRENYLDKLFPDKSSFEL